MADFDAFTGPDAPTQEEDPAADFLAREQEELAELNDDNFTGAEFSEQQPAPATSEETQEQPAVSNDDMAMFESQPPANDDLAMFESQPEPSYTNDDVPAPATQEQPAVSNDDMAMFESQPPANDDLAMFEPSNTNDDVAPQSNDDFGFGGGSGEAIPGLDALDQRLEQEDTSAQDPYSSVRSVDTQRKEPEKIRIWREEQKAMLEEKDKEETVKMEEWREQARKELDDWYRHRDEQFQKAKALNRESEAEFVKERDESLPGHEWERICRLCEFNPKNNRSQKDVARMRSILLQLKQNPTVQAKA